MWFAAFPCQFAFAKCIEPYGNENMVLLWCYIIVLWYYESNSPVTNLAAHKNCLYKMNPTCTRLQNGNANSKQLYWPAASMSFIKHAAPPQIVSSTSSNLHSQNVCKESVTQESFGKKESVAIRLQPALFASLIPHHSACNTRQVHNLMRPRTLIGRGATSMILLPWRRLFGKKEEKENTAEQSRIQTTCLLTAQIL